MRQSRVTFKLVTEIKDLRDGHFLAATGDGTWVKGTGKIPDQEGLHVGFVGDQPTDLTTCIPTKFGTLSHYLGPATPAQR